jgi:FMN phosphatase YigB (HAD superfamily)
MIKAVVTDFSKVLLFAKDEAYSGGLNALNTRLLAGDPAYPFFDHFVLNDELLDYYQSLGRKLPVYVFTTEYIQNHPAIRGRVRRVFKAVLSAQELGLKKADQEAYRSIAAMIHCGPEEILYIDDKGSNIEAASRAGLRTFLFTGNIVLMSKLDALVRSRAAGS